MSMHNAVHMLMYINYVVHVYLEYSIARWDGRGRQGVADVARSDHGGATDHGTSGSARSVNVSHENIAS